MKKIEAIIRPTRLEPVKIALGEIGINGITVEDVRGSGRVSGKRESFHDREYIVEMAVKVKLVLVIRDEDLQEVVDTILNYAHTGEPGDGKIFVYPMEEAIRVRTDERGEDVL